MPACSPPVWPSFSAALCRASMRYVLRRKTRVVFFQKGYDTFAKNWVSCRSMLSNGFSLACTLRTDTPISNLAFEPKRMSRSKPQFRKPRRLVRANLRPTSE